MYHEATHCFANTALDARFKVLGPNANGNTCMYATKAIKRHN